MERPHNKPFHQRPYYNNNSEVDRSYNRSQSEVEEELKEVVILEFIYNLINYSIKKKNTSYILENTY